LLLRFTYTLCSYYVISTPTQRTQIYSMYNTHARTRARAHTHTHTHTRTHAHTSPANQPSRQHRHSQVACPPCPLFPPSPGHTSQPTNPPPLSSSLSSPPPPPPPRLPLQRWRSRADKVPFLFPFPPRRACSKCLHVCALA